MAERLTHKTKHSAVLEDYAVRGKRLRDAIRKLAAYEDAEEQGLLIRLPKPEESDYDGLKVKYRVYKAKDNTPVENCFVLRPDKDEAAIVALRAYAEVCGNRELAHDIYSWIRTISAEAERHLGEE